MQAFFPLHGSCSSCVPVLSPKPPGTSRNCKARDQGVPWHKKGWKRTHWLGNHSPKCSLHTSNGKSRYDPMSSSELFTRRLDLNCGLPCTGLILWKQMGISQPWAIFPSIPIIESQKGWGWKGPQGPAGLTLALAATPTAGCLEWCPGGYWISVYCLFSV